MDTGALFGGIVGESEERTKRALSVAETVAPCILWIDELEKSICSRWSRWGHKCASVRLHSHLDAGQDYTPVFALAVATREQYCQSSA